jgi:hypothetical protein
LGPHTPFVIQQSCACAASDGQPAVVEKSGANEEEKLSCRLCGSTIHTVEERWYAVIRGLEVGVFEGW